MCCRYRWIDDPDESIILLLLCRCSQPRSTHGCPRYLPSSSPSPSASSPCSVAHHTRQSPPPRPRSARQSPPSSRSTSSTHYTPSPSHAPLTSSRPSASHSTHRNLRSTPRCCCSSSSDLMIITYQLHLATTTTEAQLRQCSRLLLRSFWHV